ncbi:MAG: phosphocholine cytidylyltransferase family protein [Gammaproteobacteria bacterium]|nr:phosphocholine cytidylyltransferase family protein [Gammaproteobacteria bacterium]MBI5615355.1 phosphocholine cytidylyltransferase family protein [Gammaproteobacteria bacterium]
MSTHAIMLAAGMSRRLADPGRPPKSLLEFGGRTLLERHFDCLRALGIREVTLCVGYRRELLEDVAARAPGIDVRCVHNPDFEEGSVVSLWSTRAALTAGREVILMDADVFYAPEILARLVQSPAADCLLIDRDFVPGDEPVKVCVRDGRIVEFRKLLDPLLRYDSCGESIGFFKLSPATAAALAARTEAYVAAGRRNEPYEEPLRELLIDARSAFRCEDVSGLPWIEIDFPEDIDRARDNILPRIDTARV